MSAPLAYVLAGVPLRHELTGMEMACTCGLTIVGIDERACVRIHADHQAEQRNPDEHDLDPWGKTCA